MRYRLILVILFSSVLSLTCASKSKITLINRQNEKRVDILVDGKLFTSYRWSDDVKKPILFPVNTSAGTTITRGFPIETRPLETTDHPHHTGSWLNYGNVNGYNFWANSDVPDPADGSIEIMRKNGILGSIRHIKFEQIRGGKDEGILIAVESWILPSGKELLSEKTEYHFIARESLRIIDRITTLTARQDSVTFVDTKEGMFGIRVCRQLEMPSRQRRPMTDANGKQLPESISSTDGVTGNYRSSEGKTGDSVFSTRAKWVDLSGNIQEEKVSVVMCDHPSNVSYPTFWMARGYGLFCLNPFGAKDFTSGKIILNYTIQPKKSVTLKYRIIVSSGSHLTDTEINSLTEEFSRKY